MARNVSKVTVKESEPKHGPSFLMFIVGLLVVTLVAVGGGWVISTQTYAMAHLEIAKAQKEEETKPRTANKVLSNLLELTPIVTNMGAPEEAWIRLEAAVVIDNPGQADTDVLTREITGDFLSYLRTISIAQIQGAIGLQHLRQDLMERASIRSKGRVRELIIHTLVVQ
ncbi:MULTISPECIES: flagellar basal body-associated FliL family protein [unclassified Beijerinckia]|uniref:flagellar basal body-associated FliL family protein n=1 Tax=unclassified Beijerinckia TaxID=2638183 RepID=UPI0008976781|nr:MULTISPECIES: flagellar basal body-associated FliL family protein [unclassified Beijerinckia]MDH7798650.1 flagellar FliL protein [Beijerinckia sp. GAS462]SED28004.1 flagellar FliL protein [Beijerinckia sp. 28-YEA-48]